LEVKILTSKSGTEMRHGWYGSRHPYQPCLISVPFVHLTFRLLFTFFYSDKFKLVSILQKKGVYQVSNKERKNPGLFKKGEDARRHKLTTEERRKGGQTRARQLLAEMHRASYRIPPGANNPFEVPW